MDSASPKEYVKMVALVGVLCIAGLVALGASFRSCGTETEVTCPGGGSAKIIERGNVGGGGGSEGVCQEIEGKS